MKRLGLRLHADEEHWIPLSDLMTGLMFLFLLIAVAYMVQVQMHPPHPASQPPSQPTVQQYQAEVQRYQAEAQRYRLALQQNQAVQIASGYVKTRSSLATELAKTFRPDLARWGADFDPNTLSIRFYGPDVLFASGSAALQPRFKTILAGFFPRYIAILSKPQYRDLISEVRIEGYTSTSWKSGASLNESYIGNMELSQDRTRSVLGYVLDLPAVAPQKPWLIQVLTANGLSFSHVRSKPDGTEDSYASQRVEFRVRTDADDQIRKVLQLSH